jgi:hypothetical protein
MNPNSFKDTLGKKLSMIIGIALIFYILSARNAHAYAKEVFIIYIIGIIIILILPNKILQQNLNWFGKEKLENPPVQYKKENLKDYPKVIIFLVLSLLVIIYFMIKAFI